MPRRLVIDPVFDHIVRAQDFVVRRSQALDAGMTRYAIDHRLATDQW